LRRGLAAIPVLRRRDAVAAPYTRREKVRPQGSRAARAGFAPSGRTGAKMTPPAGDHYDLIVLGAGSGGYVSAIRAAQLGMTVGIVEQR
jgi:hypothetical protein